MTEIIKLANSQLKRTPDDQIVKVAGILRRLKNWLKSKFDPEFEEQVRQLESESAEYAVFIEQLSEQVSRVQEAIKDKELEEYRVELVALKNLLNQGSSDVQASIEDTNSLQEKIDEKLQVHFREEQASNPEYVKKVKDWLKEEKGYDIPLDTRINVKFKDSNFYKNLNPSSIVYTNPAFNKLKKLILQESLKLRFNDISEDNLSLNKLLPVVQQAIVDGTIHEVTLQKPKKLFGSPKTGTLNLSVVSNSFTIPGTDVLCAFEVLIRDESPEIRNIGKKLVVFQHRRVGLSKINTANRRSNFYLKLLKTAQSNELPYKVTTLSDLQFANALKEGYKMAFGKDPSLPVLAFGWAQAALESGRPFKLPQNNVGNIKATKDWLNSGKPFFKRTTEEFTSSGKKFLHSDAAWRAYNTPQEGAAGYWLLLKSRYPEALEWAASGDAQSAGVVLGQKGYYTASIKKYSSGLQSLYKTFLEKYGPSFSSLSSEIIDTGKEKLEVKDWKADYSTSDLSKKPSGSAPDSGSVSNSDSTGEDDVAGLLNSLLRSSSTDSAYYSFVKQAIYKNTNPKKNTLITISGSDEVDNLEYANTLAYLIQDYLMGVTTIHQNDNYIYVQASAHTDSDLKQAITELSDVLSSEMKNKNNKNIYAIVSENIFSIHKKVSSDKLLSNHRKFIMRHS